MSLAWPFQYRDGVLCCEEVPLSSLAERYQTPCYVYSEGAVRDNFAFFRHSLASLAPRVFYAVKANSNQAVLGLLSELGSGFDIVSQGELYRLRRLGVPGEKIVFSGVGKSLEELEEALSYGLYSLNVESEQELEALLALSRDKGYEARLSLRINPNVEAGTHPYIATGESRHKFGIDIADLPPLLKALRGQKRLRLEGVGCHIGSQILSMEPFLAAFRVVREQALELRARGFPIRHLDLGGGFGVPASPQEPLPDLRGYAEQLSRQKEDFQFCFEPGRLIVATAGALLTRVLYCKTSGGKRFVVVDAAMNDLLRPALYGARHPIRAVREAPPRERADVVGPVCESGDFLGRQVPLPSLQPGDLLAVLNAGAYGFVLSSNYNSRRRAAEVLVHGESSRLIRRREEWRDLVEPEEL